ncbi:MAG TPA: hypothetical protein VIF83_09425 [Gemmatimonadaceae bacterium]
MRAPLNVLITSITLRYRMGVELYVRDLAVGLKRMGHAPCVYAPETGSVAVELQSQGIPVVTRVRDVPVAPDVIHGNQQRETLAALIHFRTPPAIFVCHSHTSWGSSPPQHPRIRRYLGVSRLCVERLRAEGAPHDQIGVSFNSVDTTRFLPRATLPPKPRRALVFSNYAGESTQLPAIRDACATLGIELDVVGMRTGTVTDRPEDLLGQYDLVFAKAKAALEAMAVGAAVVLCDFAGLGPMVTTGNVDRLRLTNFGHEALSEPIDSESIIRRIEEYDARDAALVRDRIRDVASADRAVTSLVALYREVLAEEAASAPAEENDLRYLVAMARDYIPEKVFLSLLAMDPRMRDALRLKGLNPVRSQVMRLIFGRTGRSD